VFLCWLQAPDTNCNGREALFEPLARIAMASARSLNSAILFGGAPGLDSLPTSRDALLAATLVRSVIADFLCKECVTGVAGKIRSARTESPLRLSAYASMPVSIDKLMISVMPEVGVEPTRF
jgi:hypothetical protein